MKRGMGVNKYKPVDEEYEGVCNQDVVVLSRTGLEATYIPVEYFGLTEDTLKCTPEQFDRWYTPLRIE